MRKLFLILMTLIACAWGAMAQNRTYHGTVVDAKTSEPLAGATVMPIGGGKGTATDLDGKFTLSVPANITTAKVSYIGYTSLEVKLHDNMNILLHSSASDLDDLVVVAYGTANKESLTGSVAVVGSKEIEDRPVTSVTAALEGNAPGVQVNNSTTQPGESPDIRIRGFNSINGNNSPLYVVDGVPYDGSVASLNPQDVESLSILKDAASCALYGNRGANGVVLITTKKAKGVGKVDVNFQMREGWNVRGLPFYERLGANQWMETALVGLINGLTTNGQPNAAEYARKNFISEVAQLNIYNKPNDQLFDTNNKLVAQMLPGYEGDRDWWKMVSQTGRRQEYTMNMAGATEKFNAFASFGYLKANGYMLQTDYERFNGRVNMNANPVKYLKVGMNLNAAQTNSDRSPVEKDALGYTNNPFSTTMKKAPIYPYYLHDKAGNIMYDDKGQPVWNVESYNETNNIAWQMREDRRNITSTQIDGSVYATAVLPYGFDFTVRGSMYRSKDNEMQYNNWLVGSQKDVGSLSAQFLEDQNYNFMQTLNWSQDYGMHHVDALLDHENYEYKYGYVYNRKSGQQLADILTMNNFEETKDLSEYRIARSSESYLGRVRYNYGQKYFVEGSVRRDGSSRFAKADRWGTFWSSGASWVITKENFMQGIDWVDFLKLRAAYGSVGNDASAPTYAYWALYEYGFALAGSTANLVPGQLAPDGLKWEATTTLDVALEGNLFNNRVNFSVGYYNKRNTDLLFWVSAPLSSGGLGSTGSTPKTLKNIGDMQNIGWELGVGVDVIRNKDLVWKVNADASFLKNKILKLPKNQNIPAERLFQGRTLYENYYVAWAGVDRVTGQSLYEMHPESPDFYTYDDNNNYVFNEDYYNSQLVAAAGKGALYQIDGKYYTSMPAYAGRKLNGTSLPTVYGSLGSNLTWKGLNVSVLFTYSLGGKSYDSNYSGLMSFGGTGKALHTDLLNSWSGKPAGLKDHVTEKVTIGGSEVDVIKGNAGDIDPNGIPQINTVNNGYNNSGSRFLTKNDYLCFKNLAVSYDLPKAWVAPMLLAGVNVGFSADNLFLATARKGFNPQFSFNGDQGAYFVPTRTYSFQLTAKF